MWVIIPDGVNSASVLTTLYLQPVVFFDINLLGKRVFQQFGLKRESNACC